MWCPVLILMACVLVALQPRLSARLALRPDRPTHGGPVLFGSVFLTGVYGGYFGAAQGVILLSLLGIFLSDHLQKLNATKNVLAFLVNGVAGLLFIVVRPRGVGGGGTLAAGSIVGGQVGGALGEAVPGPAVARASSSCGRHRRDRPAGVIKAWGGRSVTAEEGPVRLGIVTPVVNLNPRFDPPAWEVEGGIDDIVEVARAAERLGYEWVSCPEHVVIPTPTAATRGGRYWDPLATLSFVAASTQTIGLLTHVLVLGYHHPLEVVKRYGTLDVASGGRVILGVGVGSLEAGVRPPGRALRRTWGARRRRACVPSGHRSRSGPRATRGRTSSTRGSSSSPAASQAHVPIWVGGRTRRSLRTGPRARRRVDPLRPVPRGPRDDAARRRGGPGPSRTRPGTFDIVLAPEPPLDPAGAPDATATALRRYGDIGATGLALRFRHDSRAQYIEQLEAMGEVAAAVDGG